MSVPLPNSCPKNPSPSPVTPSKLAVTANFSRLSLNFFSKLTKSLQLFIGRIFQSKIIREWAIFMGKSTFFTGRKRSLPPPKFGSKKGICPPPKFGLKKSIAPPPHFRLTKKPLVPPLSIQTLHFSLKKVSARHFLPAKKLSPSPHFLV